MKKKLFALLLALCALCGTALAAEPLRVLDDWFAADRYEKRYPERALERIEPVYDETGEGNQNELLFAGEWDAAVIETNGTDLSALCADRIRQTHLVGSFITITASPVAKTPRLPSSMQ